MDIFQTTSTAIHEIYNIGVFIKAVVDDVKHYDTDRDDIRHRLNHDFVCVNQFKATFIDKGPGQDFFTTRSEELQNNCKNIVLKLASILAEYESTALKHGLITATNDNEPVPDAQSDPVKEKVGQRLKELKKKAFDWSLFDKKKLFNMLAEFREWSQRLSEIVTYMHQTKDFDGDKFVLDGEAARRMNIQATLKRQENAARIMPPDNFQPLTGIVTDYAHPHHVDEPILAKYHDSNEPGDDPLDVIVEQRPYDLTLKEHVQNGDTQQVLQAKAAVKKLAWLLHSSTFAEDVQPEISTGPQLVSLNCLGYLDIPDKSMFIFVYNLPALGLASQTPTTLYSLINEYSVASTHVAKISLGNRFFLAHALSLTVLNIHGSQWVHKNIWSKGVILYQSRNTSQPGRSDRLVPYLMGWGLARPEVSDTLRTASFDIVPNLYRHPKRQGQPMDDFKRMHDRYALGVVLIEIGLGKTVDEIFKKEIATNAVSPTRLRRWWASDGKSEVQAQMGEGYSEVIDQCIQDKKPAKEREADMIAFRDTVVDVLARGINL
jgi:hypothetical protein